MERLNLHSTLCHHTARNRRVNSAGKQKKSSSGRAKRQTSRSLLLSCSYICVVVTHLNGNCDVRILNVNLYATNG